MKCHLGEESYQNLDSKAMMKRVNEEKK